MRRLALLTGLAALSCASGGGPRADDYFRYTSFELPGNRHVVLRWRAEQMPLKVHLPLPPREFLTQPEEVDPSLHVALPTPEAVYDSVHDGITDWTDVAGPGMPRFELVGSPGEADIPIVWAREPDGDWYVAHCAWDIDSAAPRFGVSRILVTARWGREVVDLTTIYDTVLHEMGHALGIGGHSPKRGDVMYESVVRDRTANGLSDRDRATLRRLYSRPFASTVVGGRGATRR